MDLFELGLVAMPPVIREVHTDDLEALQELTVRAFEPIFASFAQILGSQIYPLAYPDWKKLQRDLVATLCSDEKTSVWVSEVNGVLVGLVAYQLREEEKTGEISFLVVHPDHQNAGIGTALNHFALTKMRAAGMHLALVGTGGDAAHAPARKAYEKAGFTPLPSVWYFKSLQ